MIITSRCADYDELLSFCQFVEETTGFGCWWLLALSDDGELFLCWKWLTLKGEKSLA
jgi:hypothetical protein